MEMTTGEIEKKTGTQDPPAFIRDIVKPSRDHDRIVPSFAACVRGEYTNPMARVEAEGLDPPESFHPLVPTPFPPLTSAHAYPPPPIVRDESFVRAGDNIPSNLRHSLRQNSDLFFGEKRVGWCKLHVGKPADVDGHALIVGGAGTGKTSSLVIPTLETWPGHIVALDLKDDGNLLARCRREGRRVLVFNPLKENVCALDPYHFLRSDGEENLARNAQELAQALLPLPPETRDPIWIKSAWSLLAGLIAYHVGLEASFPQTMIALQSSSVEELLDETSDSENQIAMMLVSKLKGLSRKVLAGIGMELAQLAILAADPLLFRALGGEEDAPLIDWTELNATTEPLTIVLQIPEAKLEVWSPMVMLVVNQLIRTLEGRPDKYSAQGKTLPPVLLLLDEFARLGRADALKSGLTTLRSRGVTFCLAIQSLAQLDEIYGAAARKTIVDNCDYKVILGVSDPESQDYFSKMIGDIIVPSHSLSVNLDSYGNASRGSFQASETRERIIPPHELAALRDIVLITPEGFCRIKKVPYYDEGGR